MTLNNLVGISIEKIKSDKDVVKRLISAAIRNIADAKIKTLSTENRFDVAYKAIMQIANTALQSQGYRTLTSKPGHHQTMIQLLEKTIHLDIQTIRVLDALRKQRNVIDYSGDIVSESMAKDCLKEAEELLVLLKKQLRL